jgi:hypothetical protein
MSPQSGFQRSDQTKNSSAEFGSWKNPHTVVSRRPFLRPAGTVILTAGGGYKLTPGTDCDAATSALWLPREYLVVWTAVDGSSPGSAIVAVHLDNDGVATSPVYPVTDPGELPTFQVAHGLPDVAYDPTNDQFLVVWEGGWAGNRISSLENQILVQRVSGNAETLGGNALISETGQVAGAPVGASDAAHYYQASDESAGK